jgi:hypothetical protein
MEKIRRAEKCREQDTKKKTLGGKGEGERRQEALKRKTKPFTIGELQ